jgi:dihydrofolate reductase
VTSNRSSPLRGPDSDRTVRARNSTSIEYTYEAMWPASYTHVDPAKCTLRLERETDVPLDEEMRVSMLRLIAAMDKERGIANDHGIPWQGKIPLDTTRFHDLTSDGLIVMGYGTYKEYDKPLHDRENYVVSRSETGDLKPGFVLIPDADQFFDEHSDDVVWLIGGAALFTSSLARADQLVLTRLDLDYHCTKFFPEFDDAFDLASDDGPYSENGITFHFETWLRNR